jgi:hypothetical protein
MGFSWEEKNMKNNVLENSLLKLSGLSRFFSQLHFCLQVTLVARQDQPPPGLPMICM